MGNLLAESDVLILGAAELRADGVDELRTIVQSIRDLDGISIVIQTARTCDVQFGR